MTHALGAFCYLCSGREHSISSAAQLAAEREAAARKAPLVVFALTFLIWSLRNCAIYITSDAICMITAGQIRAARALLGIDQRKLAELSGLSLPTIQRMEASEDTIRGRGTQNSASETHSRVAGQGPSSQQNRPLRP